MDDLIDEIAAALPSQLPSIAERLNLDLFGAAEAPEPIALLWRQVAEVMPDRTLHGLLVHLKAGGEGDLGLILAPGLSPAETTDVLRKALLNIAPAEQAAPVSWVQYPPDPGLEYVTFRRA